MKKVIAAILSTALVFSMATGCSSFSGKTTGTAGQTGQSGQTKTSAITLYLNNEIPTLNQFAASDNIAFNVLNNISEGLYRLDNNNEPQPALAKEVKISDDKLTYTFTLRDGLKWSNGDPLTSKDFKSTWLKQMTADATNNYAFIMTDYIVNAVEYSEGKAAAETVGVEAPDDKTLVVKLKAPTPYFLFLTTFVPYYALDMNFVAAQGKNYAIGKDNLVFSGPYTISQYDAAAGLTLVKNPTYWDAANVKVDTINIKIIKEQSTALNLYKAGQLSRVQLSAADVPSYKDNAEFKTHAIFRTTFLQFNTTAKGVSNLNIRKALSLAIDNTTLTTSILNNGSEAANGVVPKAMSSGVTNQIMGSLQGELKTFDAAKAKEYWNKGVAELGKAPELSIVLDDDTESKDVGTFIQSQFRTNLGIDVKLDSKTKEARRALMKSNDYQMGINAWGADYNDPMTYLQLWSEHIAKNGFRGNFVNDAYDKLIKDAHNETDNAKRAEMLVNAEKSLVGDNAVLVPLYYMGSAYLIKSDVKNLVETNAGTLELKYVTVG
nr:peptide ABC transporter substrate-binding protein [uncultured Caproiciproducens sp.]